MKQINVANECSMMSQKMNEANKSKQMNAAVLCRLYMFLKTATQG